MTCEDHIKGGRAVLDEVSTLGLWTEVSPTKAKAFPLTIRFNHNDW